LHVCYGLTPMDCCVTSKVQEERIEDSMDSFILLLFGGGRVTEERRSRQSGPKFLKHMNDWETGHWA
jgi:hypothetical protein